jgi:hypothetical protein
MSYIECLICHVDTSRGVCDAVSRDGSSFIENIEYLEVGMKQAGQIFVPEPGDAIVVERCADGQVKLCKYYSGRKTTSDNLVTVLTNIAEAKKLLPGDKLLTGPDGAFLRLFRGGLAAIGSSPLAQTLFLAVEGLVRTVAQNFELMSSGFRVYSTNDAGAVITRICFNSSDLCFSKGANNNATLESENFEFQIDVNSEGFTLFAGEIDPDTNKRHNNFVFTIEQSGDLHIISGDTIFIDMYSNGATQFRMTDSNNKVIYNHAITVGSDDIILLEETIVGNVIRNIQGNVDEEITGVHNIKVDTHSVSANTIEHSATLNKKTSGMNISQVEKVPSTDVTVK